MCYRSIFLSDREDQDAVDLPRCIHPIATLLHKHRDIDRRKRIGTMHLETVADRNGFHRLARHQCRQWALKSGEIELGDGHVAIPDDATALYRRAAKCHMQSG
jgi:hypothetical protein